MKYELRFLNIDADIIKKTLNSLDKKIIKQKVLLRCDSFDYKDKFIRLRDEGNGKITLTLKMNLNSSQPISKTIFVNNYDSTIEILKNIDINSKYRVEKIREIWELNNKCIINFDMFPGLPYYIEVKSNNKRSLMTLIKDLNLTIDPRKHSEMGADTMYLELYNIKKNIQIGDLTFVNAKKFKKYIKKNNTLFEKILKEQMEAIKRL